MKPGDIVFYRDTVFGVHRFYEVDSVNFGAVGVASVVALRPLNEKPGSVDGKALDLMHVPEPLLRDAAVYTRAVTQ